MSQFYLNGPSTGRHMSAEEFAAGACRRPRPQSGPDTAPSCGGGTDAGPAAGCGSAPCTDLPAPDCPSQNGCGQTGECCQQMICCCRPAPAPAPQPPQVEEGCCCKQSFRAALGLLCGQQASSLLDFDAVAFVTSTYTAGAALKDGKSPRADAGAEADGRADFAAASSKRPRPHAPASPNGPSDNLGPLTGSFRRFAACSRDLLDIEAELYTSGRKGCAFTATQVSLCQLDAVVIQGAAAAGCDPGAEEEAARNFRCLRAQLAQQLNPCGSPCAENGCSCACDGRDCCCAAGLMASLAQNNLSRRVSLAAGLLVLNGVTLLGAVGNVLVLSNDADNRLYFVCVNSVHFIG